MMVICQTIAGFFLMTFFSTFWALPMNTVPKALMGMASGLINMAGQIAAFVSPLLLGVIVQATGGSFDLSFLLLIAALVLSSAIVMTIKGDPRSLLHDEVRGRA
jgi:MFS-type transporter involved in bile tolerance (Atg22 family)